MLNNLLNCLCTGRLCYYWWFLLYSGKPTSGKELGRFSFSCFCILNLNPSFHLPVHSVCPSLIQVIPVSFQTWYHHTQILDHLHPVCFTELCVKLPTLRPTYRMFSLTFVWTFFELLKLALPGGIIFLFLPHGEGRRPKCGAVSRQTATYSNWEEKTSVVLNCPWSRP